MPISFDSALGIHDKALLVRSRRAELLASNIANGDTPGYKARDIDFKAALAQAIAGLPERESLVMAMYYDEELNLREIGEVLGVSESRVCQIHGQALIRLRARMAEWTGD